MREVLERLSKRELIHLVIELTQRIEGLEERIRQLEQRNAELEAQMARLRKNSSTSSKPPSSDIVKPPKAPVADHKGRPRIGGQPGHPKQERAPFPPEQVDQVREYHLKRCPKCHGDVLEAPRQAPRVVQRAELVEQPIRIEEHRALACWCPHCQTYVYAAWPAEIAKGGLVGPRLTALVGYMKGMCHASYSTIQRYFQDVLRLHLARGQLVKIVGKVSGALQGPYKELQEILPAQSVVNVDETGHKNNGKPHWTWCFRAALFTLFRIDPSRGSKVLLAVLGQLFTGVIGADYFSAYRKYMRDFNVLVQFCLAHLIRDVKFLITLPDQATRRYGERLLERLRALFHVIHRRETMREGHFQREIEKARRRILATAQHPPHRREAQNLAKRFRRYGDAYFRFITTPEIEPTNNLAEQAIRFVVIDRRITQGTRGHAGCRWSERIWTVIATCTQQGRSVYDFMQQAVHAHFTGQPAPSLLLHTS